MRSPDTAVTAPLDDVTAAADAARLAADEARQVGETLRETHSSLADALDQVRGILLGSRNPLPDSAVERWVSGLALTTQVATLVDGIAADTHRAAGPSVLDDVVLPLREALARVGRCSATIRRLRRVAELAERRLRRTGDNELVLRSAAARWGVAARRLDRLAGRLAVGERALDAYLGVLTNEPDQRSVRQARLARLAPTLRQPASEEAVDAARVSRLVALAEPSQATRRRRVWGRGNRGAAMNAGLWLCAATDSHAATLRALLRGDARGYDRRIRRLNTPGWADFLAAAFVVAVDRRFRPGQDPASVIRFVAGVRERYDHTGRDIDPTVAEALIWAALGAGTVPAAVGTVTVRTVLLLGLLADEDLSERELAAFIADVATLSEANADSPGRPQGSDEGRPAGDEREGEETPGEPDPD
jgi:hypothetical protein